MDKIYLGSYDEIYMVDPESILYIKAEDHYCQIVYHSGLSLMVPYGLGHMENIFTGESYTFLRRFGRSYIINVKYILYISTVKQIIMLGDNLGNKHNLKTSKQVLRDYINELQETNR